jgi:hypothetical protein
MPPQEFHGDNFFQSTEGVSFRWWCLRASARANTAKSSEKRSIKSTKHKISKNCVSYFTKGDRLVEEYILDHICLVVDALQIYPADCRLQFSSLRIPRGWHVSKGGHKRKKKKYAAEKFLDIISKR